MTPAGGDAAHQPSRPVPGEVRLAVAAVHDRAGNVVGAAFLTHSNRLMTCAHVVQAALGPESVTPGPDDAVVVSVSFPLVAPGRRLAALVLPEHWQPRQPDGSGDEAFLQLIASAPVGVRPVRVARFGQAGTRDRVCRVFGFPRGLAEGRWFEGWVVGPIGGGWIQLANRSDSGYQIEPGFSGAPVWDSRMRCVIGMIVAVDQVVKPQPGRPAAFMIQIRRLPLTDRFGRLRLLTRWRQPFSRWRTRPVPMTDRWSPRILARVAVFLAAVLVIGLAAVPEPLADCAGPVELRVAAAPDDLVTYQLVAEAYELSTKDRGRGCRTTNVFVYPAEPPEVARGLQLGWSATQGGKGTPGWYPADVGVRPDVWLPGADTLPQEVLRLATVQEVVTVAYTPLVLGVPRALLAPGRDEADRQGSLFWSELFAKATRGVGEALPATASGRRLTAAGWQVVRPDPTVSPEARLVDVALYGGETDPSTIRHVYEQYLETAQDERDYPLDGLAAVLCRQRQLATDLAAPIPPAVVVTEQALAQFNLNERPSDGCGGDKLVPDRKLIAFYPKQTPGVEHRMVLLRWPDSVQSPAARAAADDLRRWLTGSGRGELLKRGLRAPGLDGTGPDQAAQSLTEANGVLPGWPLDNPQWKLDIDTTALNANFQRYQRARRPARVLLALDTSGSMLAQAGRATRFDVAVDGVDASLSRLGGRDEVGVWAFSTGFERGIGRLREVGPADAARDKALIERLRRTAPAGDTPLYRAIDGAMGEMRRLGGGTDDYLRAVVVLTDGRDTASGGLTPRVVGNPQVRLFVIAVGEASCDDRVSTRTLQQTARSSGGECLQAEASTVDRTLSGLFRQLWNKGAEQ